MGSRLRKGLFLTAALVVAACTGGDPPVVDEGDVAPKQRIQQCGSQPPTTYEVRADLLALSDDGAVAWRHGLPFGEDTSWNQARPVLVGRTVSVATGLDVRGFDRASGRLRWKADLPKVTELYGAADGSTVYALADRFEPTASLVAIDASTGRRRWTLSMAERAVYDDGQLLPDGSLAVVEQKPFDPNTSIPGLIGVPAQTPRRLTVVGADGKDRWSFESGAIETGGDPLVFDQTLVWSFGPTVVGLDLETGKERWRTEVGGTRPYLVVADGIVIAAPGSLDGQRQQVAGVRPTDGQVVWRRDLDANAQTATDGEGRVYSLVTAESTLALLDPTNGADRWRSPYNGIFADDVPASGDAMWAIEQGRIPAGEPTPPPAELVARGVADGRILRRDTVPGAHRAERRGDRGVLVADEESIVAFDAGGRQWATPLPAPFIDSTTDRDGRTYVVAASGGRLCQVGEAVPG